MLNLQEMFNNGHWLVKTIEECCNRDKLNFYKVMCLAWQEETGKKCNNKNHKKEVYADTLECEAALCQIFYFTIKGSNFTDKEKEDFREEFLAVS